MMSSTTGIPATSLHAFYETTTSCQAEWQKYLQSQPKRVTLLDAVFVCVNDDELLLVAGASNGTLYLWRVPSSTGNHDTDLSNDDDDADFATSMDVGVSPKDERRRMPFRTCRIHDNVGSRLTSVRCHRVNNKQLLLVGGDHGVLVMDFAEFWSKLLSSTGTTTTMPSHGDFNLASTAHFRPYPSPTPNPCANVNDVMVIGGNVYAAVNDAFGLYKWHLETQQLVKTYRNASYIHSLQTIPNTDGSASNTIVAGGEEGVVSLWDCHQDKLIENISLNTADSRRGRSSEQKWITSLAVLDANWCSVGGGIDHGSSNAFSIINDGGTNNQGFLSTISIPTRSVVSSTDTISRPQRCAFLSNRTLATAANESVVRHWHATNLEKTMVRKTLCSSPSNHVLVVAPDGRMAVGGVGGTIDLFDSQGMGQLMQFVFE